MSELPQTKESWEKWITELESTIQLSNDTEQNYILTLSKKIENVILTLAKKSTKLGLLFSGGVDSTLIAYILQKNKIPFIAISVGFKDDETKFPEDLETSRIVAKKLNLNYVEEIINSKEAHNLFKETTKILGKEYSDVVNVGVGSVEVAGIKKLKEIHCTHIFSGLGSEELFAGYDRHDKSNDPHQECWNGLKSMFERDLVRELKITNHFKVEGLIPFLNKELIEYAMTIPAKYKISKDDKKIILRKSAMRLGLQEEFAQRPKRAAQYGSRTDKAIAKLTKKHGFKFKKDYLLSLLNV
ncbi:MAG: asparagine synthase C-terminal domain-containing protein [Candidatus Nanoarchaeia archaeon]|nr:asparagine synthase C-terminal domain-containing protein [Candidatus Nanoarchaeia archaeon]